MKKNRKHGFYELYVFFNSITILLLTAVMVWDIKNYQWLLNYIFLIGAFWSGVRIIKYSREKKWHLILIFGAVSAALLAMAIIRIAIRWR